MSSRRFRHHHTAPARHDSPHLSETSPSRIPSMNSTRRNGIPDKLPSSNGARLGSTTSSSPSDSYRSDQEVSSDEGSIYESVDPAVNQALLLYMVNTRKRHLKIKRDYISSARKLAKHRHRSFEENPVKPRPEPSSYNKLRKDHPVANYKSNAQKPYINYDHLPHRPPLSSGASIKLENSPKLPQSGYFESNSREVFVPVPLDRRSDFPSPGRPDFLYPGIPHNHPSDQNKPPSVAIWEDCVRSIPFAHKIFVHSLKSRQTLSFKMALQCQRELEKATFRRQRPVKENQARSKRALREMLVYWRRNEKDERESRKKAEKEALEKRKQEEEAREAKRQERKLNFLLTQTELYGHFISKRINNSVKDDDIGPPDAAPVDFSQLDFDKDDDSLKELAKLSAQHALKLQKDRTKQFDEGEQQRKREEEAELGTAPDVDQMNFQDPSTMQKDSNVEQPKMLTCQLKSYQLKGLNWLSNLYEQGINGILADEMGLGKTVQSISLLAHLAEAHNIWGPFLVIAPASTLHNWQQELTKFTPTLKTLPYWGNVKDRKTLRKFWSQKQLYTEDVPFHVLVTSYQLILTDKRYFQRIKWQYMVLDEAQAIKSSSSARWKTLMNFHCRNRLLLTGTPIQNSMQELWALLHFIMPSLFDSHEEFSEWFSRDIENHAENSGALDQHQLSRLHMILKPFMLRRVKKNVQHELGEKIELEVMCQLTPRQRQFYSALREKISLSELLEKSKSLDNKSVESLLNLVIQFRKVCNHPELFERAEVQSPLALCRFSQSSPVGDIPYIPYNSQSYITLHLPRLIYREGGMLDSFENDSNLGRNWINRNFNIWSTSYLLDNQFESRGGLMSLTGLSPSELSKSRHLFLPVLRHQINLQERGALLDYHYSWTQSDEPVHLKSPQALLQAIREHKNMLSVADFYCDQFLGLRIKGCYQPKVIAPSPRIYCSDMHQQLEQESIYGHWSRGLLFGLPSGLVPEAKELAFSSSFSDKGYDYSNIGVPPIAKLIMNSGKLMALDKLLTRLKAEGHRVLLYSQMTKMIDLMEEYLTYRQHSYLRLDGSSRISDRRDLVDDWQTRPDLFVFLLSTRAGGLGINLTAADTVIFYDSDWNPTVDQQAMDRAHRLGQTRQVTVYRLVTRGTIEERILQRAKQKDAIHRVVIAGGDFKAPELKPKEIFSLLLDDDQMSPQAAKSPVIVELPDMQPADDDSKAGLKPLPVPIAAASDPTSPKGKSQTHIESDISADTSIANLEPRRPPTSIADLLGPSDEDLLFRSRTSPSKHRRENDSDSEEAKKRRFLSL